MSRFCIVITVSMLVWGVSTSAPKALAQGTANFQINVPRKMTSGQLPIMRLKATVSLASEPTVTTPVTFRITDPTGQVKTIGPFNPGPGTSPSEVEFDIPPPAGGVTPVAGDIVSITSPSSALPANDPGRRRYVLTFDLSSDFNQAASCANTMTVPTNETWTVAVTAGSPLITGVCLQSFDRNILGNECTGPLRPVPLLELVATVSGFPSPEFSCVEARPAVDVILALDKSGSMSGSTLGGGPRPKIEALRDAVTDFVDVWNILRTSEGAAAPQDKIGAVFFDSDAHWMNDVGVPAWSSITDGLNNFNVSLKNNIINHIDEVNAGGSTSMGDGLFEASDKLFDLANAGNGHRKVILVMSNGKENTTKRVKVNNPANPTQVQTYDSGNPGAATALPNQGNLDIYSVTVGTSTAVSADINEDIATATGGFYINSVDDAELLRPFFLELLQNFLKFNTWEMVRMISGKVTSSEPYSASFPITTTTQAISINLLWNGRLGVLRLTVEPPGGGNPIEETGQGSIRLNLELPMPPPYDPTGSWSILVELLDPIGHVTEIPFDLVVLADDLAVNSDLSIAAADYAPGDQIRLQAKVTEFGKPVLGLGSNPGDKILVQLVKPGVGIGDLLSDSNAEPNQPNTDDTMTAADAKLYNELQKNPDSLVRTPDTVSLLDNGNGVLDDGIYSAVYPAELPGHYNFLFALEGTTQNTGRFSRQQLKTVHVRSVPEADNTEIQTSIQQSPDGNTLIIDMTPRTKFGHRMGPGWANYFWFTTPDRPPFKAEDNLDGIYRAKLFLGKDAPPPLKLHFLRVSVIIDDEVTPDNLPIPLDEKTSLVESVPVPEIPQQFPWLWILVLLLILILLILVLIWKRRQKP
ncbi:MAG: VWA domain-containing protein [Gammaproteobacteria bacterium]|nr:VWA domain-containing protein [Gammaproteobacteria bacterium]